MSQVIKRNVQAVEITSPYCVAVTAIDVLTFRMKSPTGNTPSAAIISLSSPRRQLVAQFGVHLGYLGKPCSVRLLPEKGDPFMGKLI